MISVPDLVNGLFECLSAPFILLSIIQLHKDKEVKGVSWKQVGFFSVWGTWNLYYYPHLDQWASFAGGILIVLANTFWLGQMLYYRKEKK